MIQIDKGELFDAVKTYCETQYAELDKDFENQYMKDIPRRTLVDKAFDRAYGAVMFVTNDFIGYYESLDLTNWWNNEMNPKFWAKRFEVIE